MASAPFRLHFASTERIEIQTPRRNRNPWRTFDRHHPFILQWLLEPRSRSKQHAEWLDAMLTPEQPVVSQPHSPLETQLLRPSIPPVSLHVKVAITVQYLWPERLLQSRHHRTLLKNLIDHWLNPLHPSQLDTCTHILHIARLVNNLLQRRHGHIRPPLPPSTIPSVEQVAPDL